MCPRTQIQEGCGSCLISRKFVLDAYSPREVTGTCKLEQVFSQPLCGTVSGKRWREKCVLYLSPPVTSAEILGEAFWDGHGKVLLPFFFQKKEENLSREQGNERDSCFVL